MYTAQILTSFSKSQSSSGNNIDTNFNSTSMANVNTGNADPTFRTTTTSHVPMSSQPASFKGSRTSRPQHFPPGSQSARAAPDLLQHKMPNPAIRQNGRSYQTGTGTAIPAPPGTAVYSSSAVMKRQSSAHPLVSQAAIAPSATSTASNSRLSKHASLGPGLSYTTTPFHPHSSLASHGTGAVTAHTTNSTLSSNDGNDFFTGSLHSFPSNSLLLTPTSTPLDTPKGTNPSTVVRRKDTLASANSATASKTDNTLALDHNATKPKPKTSTERRVLVRTEFVYADPGVQESIYLCGDWNNWNPIPMNHEEGDMYSTIAVVPNGYREFCYLVDNQWTVSSKHPLTSDGSCNWRTVYGPPKPKQKALSESIRDLYEGFGEAFRNAMRQTAADLGSATGVKPIPGKSRSLTKAGSTARAAQSPAIHDGDMEGGNHDAADHKSRGLHAVASAMGLGKMTPIRYFILAIIAYMIVYILIIISIPQVRNSGAIP